MADFVVNYAAWRDKLLTVVCTITSCYIIVMNDSMKEFMFFIPTLLCEALNKWSTLKKGYKVLIVKLSAVGASLFFSVALLWWCRKAILTKLSKGHIIKLFNGTINLPIYFPWSSTDWSVAWLCLSHYIMPHLPCLMATFITFIIFRSYNEWRRTACSYKRH